MFIHLSVYVNIDVYIIDVCMHLCIPNGVHYDHFGSYVQAGTLLNNYVSLSTYSFIHSCIYKHIYRHIYIIYRHIYIILYPCIHSFIWFYQFGSYVQAGTLLNNYVSLSTDVFIHVCIYKHIYIHTYISFCIHVFIISFVFIISAPTSKRARSSTTT